MTLTKENIKKILGIIIFSITFYWLLNNLVGVRSIVSRIFGLLSPFILGGVFAFVLNIPMTKIENLLKKKVKSKRFPVRTVSIILSLVIFLGIIAFVLLLLIPELIDNVKMLIDSIPKVIDDIQVWILNLANNYPDIQKQISSTFQTDMNYNDVVVKVLNYVINGSVSFITGTVSKLFTLFTALVFAVYMLSQKEYLLRGIKKIMYAYVKKNQVDKILDIANLANNTFSKFISGQCVEAIILGCIFFVVLTLCGFPYALLISVLTAVTALIPMFGAMIAMLVGALLISVNNLFQALLFIIVFQIIQQIENNFIYPKVVGKSVGLSSIWTLLAVLLGGNLMGITGMIIGLPLASVVYAIICNDANQKLKAKKINI